METPYRQNRWEKKKQLDWQKRVLWKHSNDESFEKKEKVCLGVGAMATFPRRIRWKNDSINRVFAQQLLLNRLFPFFQTIPSIECFSRNHSCQSNFSFFSKRFHRLTAPIASTPKENFFIINSINLIFPQYRLRLIELFFFFQTISSIECSHNIRSQRKNFSFFSNICIDRMFRQHPLLLLIELFFSFQTF